MLAAAAATAVVGAQALEGGPGAAGLPEGERRLGQPQQRRLRHDEQHDDAVGRDVPEDVPERQDPGRGQGLARRRPPALIAGTSQFGPMSRADAGDRDRPVRGEVRLQADAAPHVLRRARDLREQGQPASRSSRSRRSTRSSRRRGSAATRRTSRPGASSASPATGRTGRSASTAATRRRGTYGFFKEHMLKNGDYKDTVKEQPGSASVVQGVTEDRFGIGYSGIGYKTSGVKAVPLAETDKGPFSDGSYEDVQSGKYPLCALPLHLRQQGAGQAARPAGRGVREAHLQQGRPGGRGQGRLPAALRRAVAEAELAKARVAAARRAGRPYVPPGAAIPGSPRHGHAPDQSAFATRMAAAAKRIAPRQARRPRGRGRHHASAASSIIVGVLVILVFIVAEAMPLFRPARRCGGVAPIVAAPRRRARRRTAAGRRASTSTSATSTTVQPDGRVVVLPPHATAPRAATLPVPGARAARADRRPPRAASLGDFVAAGHRRRPRRRSLQVRFTPRFEDQALTDLDDRRCAERGVVDARPAGPARPAR